MRQRVNKVLFFLLLMVPYCVNASDYLLCGNDKKIPLVLGNVISIVFVLIKILVPILLVITGMISFLKATLSGKVDDELQKAKKSLVNKIIAAVIIFFIVSITNFAIALVAGRDNSFSSCLNCMIHPSNCEQVDSDLVKLCPGLLSQQQDYDDNCKYIGNRKGRVNYSNTGSTGVPNYGGVGSSRNGSSVSNHSTWLQDDPQWGSIRLGQSNLTIASHGCCATSIAILIQKSGTPLTVSQFDPGVLVKNVPFNGALIQYNFSKIAPKFKFVTTRKLSGSKSNKTNQIKQALDEGFYVMITVNDGGHYVACDSVVGDTVYISDPGHVAVDLFTDYKVNSVTEITLFKNEG